jgi:hypothetical protein
MTEMISALLDRLRWDDRVKAHDRRYPDNAGISHALATDASQSLSLAGIFGTGDPLIEQPERSRHLRPNSS